MTSFTIRTLAVAATLIGTAALTSCAPSADIDKLESALNDTRTIVDAAAASSDDADLPGLTSEECDGGARQVTEWNVEIDPQRRADILSGSQDILEANGLELTNTSTSSDDDNVDERQYESGSIRVTTVATTTDTDAWFSLTADTGCH